MGLLLTQHFLPFLICHCNSLWRSLFSTQAEIPESWKCMNVSQCQALQHSHTKRTIGIIAMHQAKYHLMSFLTSTFLRSMGTFYGEGLFCGYSMSQSNGTHPPWEQAGHEVHWLFALWSVYHRTPTAGHYKQQHIHLSLFNIAPLVRRWQCMERINQWENYIYS